MFGTTIDGTTIDGTTIQQTCRLKRERHLPAVATPQLARVEGRSSRQHSNEIKGITKKTFMW